MHFRALSIFRVPYAVAGLRVLRSLFLLIGKAQRIKKRAKYLCRRCKFALPCLISSGCDAVQIMVSAGQYCTVSNGAALLVTLLLFFTELAN
jgi:hypothetical protein